MARLQFIGPTIIWQFNIIFRLVSVWNSFLQFQQHDKVTKSWSRFHFCLLYFGYLSDVVSLSFAYESCGSQLSTHSKEFKAFNTLKNEIMFNYTVPTIEVLHFSAKTNGFCWTIGIARAAYFFILFHSKRIHCNYHTTMNYIISIANLKYFFPW